MGRHALLLGVRDYEDDGLHSLPAVVADLHCLSQVLEEPAIGGFEVEATQDCNADAMKTAIGEFLDARTADDVVLLYLSGHGIWSTDVGQLYFAVRDTHRDRLPATGVSAEYLNDALEGCRARQKVLLLDCCYSGAFAQGFRTRSAGEATDEPPVPSSPVKSRGVYVITASDQRQSAYEGLPIDGDVQPSLFTGAMVEGLRTGQADVKGNGAITPDDLFEYVSQQLNLQGRVDQSPTKSTLALVGRIELARSVAGRPLPLRPLGRAEGQAGSDQAISSAPAANHLDEDAWRSLLDHYRRCLALEAANDTFLPPRQAGRQRFALWMGADEILVGNKDSVRVASGTEAEALVHRAQSEGRELAYGYPAVLLFDHQSARAGKLAPLFTRTVEPFLDKDGWHLQPVGPVMLHPGLMKQFKRIDAEAAMAEFEPNWSAGSHNQLAREARKRLEELGLATDPLRPEELDSTLDDQHPRSGGRNAALLYEAPECTDMTRGVVDELGKLRDQTANFAGTALGAFARSPGPADPGSPDETGGPPRVATGTKPFEVVAPFDLNEAQEAVLRSAMTHPLTVATGPPGTGKSQLVANVVATTVANGSSVLVTSTNNRAVDEVWERRCKRLTPGLVLRTGSARGERDYEQAEIDDLRGLLNARPPDAQPDPHALRLRNEDHVAMCDQCAHKARTEAELLELSLRRLAAASSLGFDPADLPTVLAQDSKVEALQRRAQSTSTARVFGGWRRRRLAILLGLPDAARATCSTTAEFLEIEARWRRLCAEADRLPSDEVLAGELRTSRMKVRKASEALVKAVVAANVHKAQAAITQRLQALQGSGSPWGAVNRMRPHLGGWAVTTHSARRLPLDAAWFDLVIVDEATQCSIPAVLPMLYRAKRALIIGDPMQLTHITTCSAAQNGASRRAAGLEAAFLERLGLDYVRHSAFHAAATAFGEAPLMLDEHFRCHPEIIALPNRLCYGGRLTVLTDPKGLARAGSLARLKWVDVDGSPVRSDGGSWSTEAEVEKVQEIVTWLRGQLKADATIGVVTPFAAQKAAIEGRVGNAARVGTVHTFQGGECDAMVLSLVGSSRMRNSTVSWLERSANLWNVAIT